VGKVPNRLDIASGETQAWVLEEYSMGKSFLVTIGSYRHIDS
jgi:hypothetical protein